MNTNMKMKHWIVIVSLGSLGWPIAAHTQDKPHEEAAIENTPADGSEPSLDDLLGLTDGEDDKAEPDDKPADDKEQGDDKDAAPELTRDLEKRLSGQEASEQFVQAIQEMEEVAIRLGDESDPGVDTQRLQDEIILKLEQIISSAEKSPNQKSPKQGKPGQGKPRQADKQQGQQPGQEQGEKPGQKPGEKPGDQQAKGEEGKKPGEGEGEKPGEKPGDQQANNQDPNGKESGNNASQGSVRNAELSMKDLREGEWGNLPPRLRDELSESLSETFNPVYRAATEAFYRRIAELSSQQAEEGDE